MRVPTYVVVLVAFLAICVGMKAAEVIGKSIIHDHPYVTSTK